VGPQSLADDLSRSADPRFLAHDLKSEQAPCLTSGRRKRLPRAPETPVREQSVNVGSLASERAESWGIGIPALQPARELHARVAERLPG
jgi:hypothetical protein